MNGYGDFAEIYDELTFDVDYSAMCNYIEELFVRHLSKKPQLIADLACGTGSVCIEMDSRGYDMIGIDISPQMLNRATEKSENRKILYLNQDICEFELYGTVDCFTCLLDSVNHLTDDGDIERLFSLVHNYLNPHGVFIFDVNSEYKFEHILSDNIFTYENDNIFYVWENNYEDNICDMYVNFFVNNGESYKRIEQAHSERFYSDDEILRVADDCGLKLCGVYGEGTFSKPTDDCQRKFWVLKKE